jgi:hypothetical protein
MKGGDLPAAVQEIKKPLSNSRPQEEKKQQQDDDIVEEIE